MGVPGLLPRLAVAGRVVDDIVKECRGQRCGVDGHVWLHTFCLVHYQDVVTMPGQPANYEKVIAPAGRSRNPNAAILYPARQLYQRICTISTDRWYIDAR